MDSSRVKKTLRQVRKTYRKILDSSSIVVLDQAEAKVEVSKQKYDYAKRNQTRGYEVMPWGYEISHEQPLRFKPSAYLGLALQVDLYCDIKWVDEEDLPVKQDIKVRIWSEHNATIFDSKRDSVSILEKLTTSEREHNGRVVMRFHLDRANPDQKLGPVYHIQYGGNPHEYELCWHPKSINIPRLVHQPMEIFLACQMIAANFFWEEYVTEIRGKSEWREEILFYENALLQGYYEKCLEALNATGGRDTLLDQLWVV